MRKYDKQNGHLLLRSLALLAPWPLTLHLSKAKDHLQATLRPGANSQTLTLPVSLLYDRGAKQHKARHAYLRLAGLAQTEEGQEYLIDLAELLSAEKEFNTVWQLPEGKATLTFLATFARHQPQPAHPPEITEDPSKQEQDSTLASMYTIAPQGQQEQVSLAHADCQNIQLTRLRDQKQRLHLMCLEMSRQLEAAKQRSMALEMEQGLVSRNRLLELQEEGDSLRQQYIKLAVEKDRAEHEESLCLDILRREQSDRQALELRVNTYRDKLVRDKEGVARLVNWCWSRDRRDSLSLIEKYFQ